MERIGRELTLETIALTYLPSLEDIESDVYLNKINPTVENTIIMYRRSKIIQKYIHLKTTIESFKNIQIQLDQSINIYYEAEKYEGG